MNRFSAMLAAGGNKAFADEIYHKSTFVYNNATAGTGIASLDAATTRSTTSGILNLYNAAAASDADRLICPVRLRLRAASVNTTASNGSIAIYTDNQDRVSSGGTALTATACVMGDSAYTLPTSYGTVKVGSPTLAAQSAEKKIYEQVVISTILAAGDVFDIWFGDGPATSDANTGHPDTIAVHVPPVWLHTGASMTVWWYGASQAADPDFEFHLETIESVP